MGIKFDKNPFAAEQNNYVNKIVNAYIVYSLAAWSRNPPNNFKFKNCLFGATNIVKNFDREKWIYSIYEKSSDSASSWNFANDFAKNVKILGVYLITIHCLILTIAEITFLW